ncbi:MAG: hypothetical protein AB7S26_29060 [Sandaracinaceae bacterium]
MSSFPLLSLEVLGQPPSCPDYGFPALPASADRCTHPWIEVYDAPCNEQTIQCLLFRARHYVFRQSKLAALLARRPTVERPSREKITWCTEVLRLIVDLADDTNIRHGFLSGYDVPDHFDETRRYLNGIRAYHGGVEVPLMFPELWLTGTGSEAVPSNASMIGHHVLSLLGPRVDTARGAYLWMPPGRTTGYMLERVRAPHDLEKPRPIPTTLRTRDITAEALTQHLFDTAPGRDGYLVGQIERATGSAPCLFVGPSARECFTYERFEVAIAGAEATMDLLEANARDWVNTPFGVVINAGFRRYATYLLPYAESGRLALDPDALREQIVLAQRRQAQAAVGTAMSIASAVASVGGAVGAVVALIGVVISLLLEVLPMAWGSGTCPVLGFRRALTDPGCAAPTPQGNPNIAALLSQYNTSVAQAGAGAVTTPSSTTTDAATRGSSASSALPWIGAAAIAAVLVGALALRQKRRSSAPPPTDLEEEP